MQPTRHLVPTFLFAALVSGCAAPYANAPAPIPPAVSAPAGAVAFVEFRATGAQIYRCAKLSDTNYAWQLKAPDAILRTPAGADAGKHYAGPTWEALDGSVVAGAAVASAPAPSPDSVAWLLLAAKSHSGTTGLLTPTRYVQRVDTHGGVAPAGGCAAGNADAETRVPYSARYVFLR